MRAQTTASRTLAVTILLAAALAVSAAPLAAQFQGDRQLLKTSSGDPSIMILFDTSASMNWASTCTQADIDAGHCDFLCLQGSCAVPMGGDDPASKFYQAKEALYRVLTEIPDASRIHWGIATLNQDHLAVGAKHWIYQIENVVGENNISLPAGLAPLFAIGTREVFGAIAGTSPPFDYTCDRYVPGVDNTNITIAGYRQEYHTDDFEVGCYPNTTDSVAMNGSGYRAWEVEKLHRLPKGGVDGTHDVSYYVQTIAGGTATIYKITVRGAAEPFRYADDASFDVRVDIGLCATDINGVTTCPLINGNLKVTFSRDGDTSFFFSEGVLNYHRDSRGRISATDDSKRAYFGGYPDRRVESWDSFAVDQPGADGVFWASDVYAQDTCRGWDPSGTTYPDHVYNEPPNLTGTDIDPFDEALYPDYNLRFPDDGYTFDLTGGPWDGWQHAMLRGDVIPLDWLDDNYTRILERLAPGGDPDVNPDTFKQAPYFDDEYEVGEGFLRLKNEDQRPMIAHGLTPLAGWFSYARSWYTGCGDPGQCEHVGWKDIRSYYDPNAACSKTYVLMITDGDETCDNNEDSLNYYGSDETNFPDGFRSNSDQCRYRASFQAQEDVESLVIGFGVEDQNKLQCAGTPVVFVYNKEELFDALEEFISKVLEEAAAFASAAVPSVQTNIADKIYLSSFVPLNGSSIWPGRLDSFLKPLPLDDSGIPDRTEACATFDPTVDQSECFAWDAGDAQPAWNGEAGYDPQGLLLQAPIAADIVRGDNDTLQIGLDVDERRVFFGIPDSASVTSKLQYFQYPEDPETGDPTEQANFEYAWNLPISTPGTAQSDDNYADIAEVIEFTLQEKQGEIDNPLDPANPDHIQYVMGDIFHSNPLVLNPPADFDYFTSDLYWNTELCGEDLDDTRARGPQISYSWYSNKNLCRRVMVMAGSDDGQLHVADGGIYQGTDCRLNLPANAPDRTNNADDDGIDGVYDYGTGRELFAFIPDAMMPLVKELSEVSELTIEYGIDGSVRAADVFVDPVLAADGTPTCVEREWRTVLLSNYREGGPGIFALDITQPDTIDNENVPEPRAGSPAYVPSCTMLADGTTPANCGELPFPALKWEFRDLDANGLPADDDGNTKTDLAESWSRPLVARLQVCDGACDTDAEPEDRYVAIFGGGLSELPFNDSSDVVGNWLYMVDIETGEPIYKRGGSGAGTTSPIVGSVAADITGVDFNVNGLVDTLYFGTTAGYVYKVDLGDGPFELDADGQIEDPTGQEGEYDPFQIFTTGGRPIYLEINAVYVPKLRANALLFGTGNRWNLWDFAGGEGRFYAIVDRGWDDTDRDGVIDFGCTTCPLTEAQFESIDPTDNAAAVSNYLFQAQGVDQLPGWYFTLDNADKLITEPFTLSGVTFFTVFAPVLTELDTNLCALAGESKLFVVNTVTTAGYAIQAGSTDRTRFTTAPTFTTQPFVERSSTKNIASSSTENADSWTDELRLIYEDLKKLFPPGARFANYTLDIKTIRSDTGIVFIAPVPVAIEPHDWKEF